MEQITTDDAHTPASADGSRHTAGTSAEKQDRDKQTRTRPSGPPSFRSSARMSRSRSPQGSQSPDLPPSSPTKSHRHGSRPSPSVLRKSDFLIQSLNLDLSRFSPSIAELIRKVENDQRLARAAAAANRESPHAETSTGGGGIGSRPAAAGAAPAAGTQTGTSETGRSPAAEWRTTRRPQSASNAGRSFVVAAGLNSHSALHSAEKRSQFHFAKPFSKKEPRPAPGCELLRKSKEQPDLYQQQAVQRPVDYLPVSSSSGEYSSYYFHLRSLGKQIPTDRRGSIHSMVDADWEPALLMPRLANCALIYTTSGGTTTGDNISACYLVFNATFSDFSSGKERDQAGGSAAAGATGGANASTGPTPLQRSAATSPAASPVMTPATTMTATSPSSSTPFSSAGAAVSAASDQPNSYGTTSAAQADLQLLGSSLPKFFILRCDARSTTARNLLATGILSVSLATSGQSAMFKVAGDYPGSKVNKPQVFSDLGFQTTPGTEVDVPLLDGGLQAWECRVSSYLEDSDGFIVFVVAVCGVTPRTSDRTKPLLFGKGAFFSSFHNDRVLPPSKSDMRQVHDVLSMYVYPAEGTRQGRGTAKLGSDSDSDSPATPSRTAGATMSSSHRTGRAVKFQSTGRGSHGGQLPTPGQAPAQTSASASPSQIAGSAPAASPAIGSSSPRVSPGARPRVPSLPLSSSVLSASQMRLQALGAAMAVYMTRKSSSGLIDASPRVLTDDEYLRLQQCRRQSSESNVAAGPTGSNPADQTPARPSRGRATSVRGGPAYSPVVSHGQPAARPAAGSRPPASALFLDRDNASATSVATPVQGSGCTSPNVDGAAGPIYGRRDFPLSRVSCAVDAISRAVYKRPILLNKDFAAVDLEWARCAPKADGHTGLVTSLAFNPEDTIFLVTGGVDCSIRLWNIAKKDGVNMRTWTDHTGPVRNLAFHPSGLFFVSSSDDKTARVWSLSRSECVSVWDLSSRDAMLNNAPSYTFPPQFGVGILRDMNFSLDGSLLASAGFRRCNIWDIERGVVLQSFCAHKLNVYSVSYHPLYNVVATAGDDNEVKVWDVDSGKCIHRFSGHRSWVNCVRFSEDGVLIGSASNDASVHVQDWRTRTSLFNLTEHRGPVHSVQFGGNMIFSGGKDSVLRVFSQNTGDMVLDVPAHLGSIYSLAYASNLGLVASAGSDEFARLWNMRFKKLRNVTM